MKKMRKIKEMIRKTTIWMICLALLFMSFPMPLTVFAESTPKTTSEGKSEEIDYVYLSDIDYVSASVGYSTVKINKNDSGEMISVLIDGVRTYSMNAIFAHANSTIIYDLRDFDFDTFSTYVGVDASKGSNGNGVKFYIYGSKADTYHEDSWVQLASSNVLKGDSSAYKINVSLEDYKWLKLYAYNNNDASYDHAVYVDAMLYDSKKYSPKEVLNIPWMKTVEEYDSILLQHSDEEILENPELKLQLMQRTFVSRVGYSILQAFANKNDKNYEFLSWLFTDEERLEKYLLGGTPEGNNYLQALTVFCDLYHTYGEDLKDSENGELYLKMMMAISLAYGDDVNFWQTAEKPVVPVRTPSDAMDRYKVIKKLYNEGYTYEDVSTHFEKDVFKDLEIEEMRWVVNNRISDIEIAWLNWYTQMTKNHKTSYNADGYMNPYSYIYYAGGYYYEDPKYYEENSTYCAYGNNLNKNASKDYKRGMSCNEKYGLEHFGLQTREDSPLRLWTVWEEDGVCGSLAGTGSNIQMAYGIPSTLVSQPGHAAFFVSSLKTWNGKTLREWQIGNAAAGWAASFKGERMLLNWGTRNNGWSNSNNGAYLLVAQRAVDEWDSYQQAFYYNLIANVRTELSEKIATYKKAIQAQPYNVDAWYNLIQCYLKDETKNDQDYYELAKEITTDFFEFPLPMYDLLQLIDGKIVHNQVAFANLVNTTLQKQLVVKDTEYFQAPAMRDIAKYLLGIKENSDIATFSFDGENANQLQLIGKALEQKMSFEYTLNYEYDAQNKKVSDKTEWIQVTEGETSVDLSKDIPNMNEKNDIVVHLLVNDKNDIDNLFFINLEEGEHASNLYVNNLERRVAGIDEDVAEWILIEDMEQFIEFLMASSYNDFTWTKFSEKLPPISDDGETMLFVRNGYTKTYLPSEPVFVSFDAKTNQPDVSYVPVSRLQVEVSSSANEGDEEKLLDRSIHTYWQAKKDDKENWVIIKTDEPIQLAKVDYVPRQNYTATGNITKAKIETSSDGETWKEVATDISWKDDTSIKSVVLEKPVRAQYVKITALESTSNLVSAAMFNLYENTLDTTIHVDDLTISYVKEGYEYTGTEITPSVTVKDGKEELVLGSNYTVQYHNNVNAGTATMDITGMGMYEGTTSREFTIAKASNPPTMPELEMQVDVTKKTLSDIPLPKGWKWKEEDMVIPSGETIVAKAIYEDSNNYENVEVSITITKEKGSHPVITVLDNQDSFEFEFTGKEVKTLEELKGMFTIIDQEDGPISIDDTEKVTFISDINWEKEGTYHITIQVVDSDGNQVEKVIPVLLIDRELDPIELKEENFEVTILDKDLFYTGEELEIPVSIKDQSNHELTLGIDYDIQYSERVNAGEHKLTITGKNIYTGTITKTYTIQKAKQPKEMVAKEIYVSYDATRLDQIPLSSNWQWKDEGIELVEGENQVTIVYIGDSNHERYEMEIIVIREKEKPIEDQAPVIQLEQEEYHFTLEDTEVSLEDLLKNVTILDQEDGEISIQDDKVTIESNFKWEVGTWTIKISVTDSKGNTTAAMITIFIEDPNAPKIDIQNCTMVVDEKVFFYDGKELKPTVRVYDGEKLLEEGKDYIITYQNNIQAGIATITILGQGDYTGLKTFDFTISKASPKNMPPSNIEVSEKVTSIKDVPLPEGWHWEDETVVLKEGKNEATAIYDGDDNHISMKVVVVVTKKITTTKPNTNQNTNSKPNTNQNHSTSSNSKPSNTNQNSNLNTNTNTNSNGNTNTQTSNSNTNTNTNTNSNSNSSSKKEEQKLQTSIKDEKTNPWFYVIAIGSFVVGVTGLVVLLNKRLKLQKK